MRGCMVSSQKFSCWMYLPLRSFLNITIEQCPLAVPTAFPTVSGTPEEWRQNFIFLPLWCCAGCGAPTTSFPTPNQGHIQSRDCRAGLQSHHVTLHCHPRSGGVTLYSDTAPVWGCWGAKEPFPSCCTAPGAWQMWLVSIWLLGLKSQSAMASLSHHKSMSRATPLMGSHFCSSVCFLTNPCRDWLLSAYKVTQ